MKFIHTSDWHLGRRLGEHALLDDQPVFCDCLVELAVDEGAELVVVAGDVYDRDVPPTEAVTLFRSTVRGLVESGIKVAAIAGNHDSAERLSAYDGLTERSGVLVRGGFTSADAPGRCKRRQPLTRHLHNRVARRSVAPTLRACLVRVSTCSG